jgi:thiamine-monophosphate kinase
MNEFDIIRQIFKTQAITRQDVALGIGDDAAILTPPLNQQLVTTTDTLISGVHFPENTSAYDIGYKALAVNLSDLAAMGATPAWLTLALTLPNADPTWLHDFAKGFFELSTQHHTQLIGGDLTHGALSITIQATGFIPEGQALKRSDAKPGDLIYVTNTLGDAALALNFLQKKISIPANYLEFILARLNRPTPRVAIGEELRNVAHAAIDISDGLAADLKHILENSHVGATVNVESIPLSEALRHSVNKEQAIALALSGGDDYELCFTVPPNKKNHIPANCTCIGEITTSNELDLRYSDNTKYNLQNAGYQHFR